MPDNTDARLGFTVIALSLALEEALKALADKNSNRAGPWLDEVEDLALLRARGRLTDANAADAAAVVAVVQAIFARMRSGYESAPITA